MGATQFVTQFVRYLNTNKLIAAAHASGHKKSAVLRAGLVPSLLHGKARLSCHS